jgi:vancomycin resistance protein VanJ
VRLGWLLSATGVYASTLLAITFLNRIGADRFWLGALNLYLPQFMWAVPGVVLTLLIFRVDRAWSWLPLLCVLWVLGPIMDGKISPGKSVDSNRTLKLRVMTWNIKYGSYQIAPLLEELECNAPDLVFFQDASGSMNGPLRDYFSNWQVRAFGQYVIASKYPLSEAQVHELPSFGGGKERFLRCQMTVGPALVSLYNVHLKTPRRSLNGFRAARTVPWYLPEAIDLFDHNVRTRELQALCVAGALSHESGPVLVAGDLNAPDGSLACATLRNAGLHDAFSEGGLGYGYSYGQLLFKHRLPWLQLSWMRIDHIMLGRMFVAERCWTGTGEASDHRPVVADLRLRYR